MKEVLDLKSRIFGTQFLDEGILTNYSQKDQDQYLEEILESLSREKDKDFVVFEPLEKKVRSAEELDNQILWIENEKTKIKQNIILYEFEKDMYYVYVKRKQTQDIYTSIAPKIPKDPDLKKHNYGLFIPSGVVVRRVSQSILGTGVLGRAFIGMNYIEILDSLLGNAYQEVLAHEVMHIMHPDKKEMEIRNMTRNYIGPKNTIYH